MAMPLRIQYENATYHVACRGKKVYSVCPVCSVRGEGLFGLFRQEKRVYPVVPSMKDGPSSLFGLFRLSVPN